MDKGKRIFESVDKTVKTLVQLNEPTGQGGTKIFLSPGNLIKFISYEEFKKGTNVSRGISQPGGVMQIDVHWYCGYLIVPDFSIVDNSMVAKKSNGIEILKVNLY